MTITFPLLISLIPVGISTVLLAVGWYLWRKATGLGAIVLSIAVLFGVVFGPMLFLDRVIIDEIRIEQTTGFWFDPTVKGFDFDDLSRIVITTGRDLKGREIEIWVAKYNHRESVQIDPGDLWATNGGRIVSFLRSNGISVLRTD